ncbi:cyclase family protein [Legionella sp. 16cNR16C]|uniref:cyclase family protein n=1 Tax=Legionella sp. 16cNR16C TaxID=2905656 RepID=UPI001E56EB5C|nr:cyclase family protein [Legionella sp. 16cNR16C]MCE3046035.1 cyclase family protein [Legionella sp. 16cNR16C]
MNYEFPYHIIDLTQTISENCPTWENKCGFSSSLIIDYSDCDTDVKFRVERFNMEAGVGTHMDAPAHCVPGGASVEQIPLSQLIIPAVVIDISATADGSSVLSVQDIKKFEELYGLIPQTAFVLIHTGWCRFWSQPERYHNNYQFPCVSAEAAQYLLSRQISGLGIDTLSPDRPESGYPVHHLLLNAGKIIIENATNLEQLPSVGSFLIISPMKVQNATESPVRLLGLIQTKGTLLSD